MKKLLLLSLVSSLAALNLYGIALSGSITTGSSVISNLSVGNSSFVFIDTANDGLDFDVNSIGVTLASGTSLDDDFIASYNDVATSAFFPLSVSGEADFSLGTAGTAANQDFYVVVFGGSTTGDNITITGGETFGIAQGTNWQLPANNGGSFSYGSTFDQVASIDGNQFTVVPEPSTYALLAGIFSLGYIAVRRSRKSDETEVE